MTVIEDVAGKVTALLEKYEFDVSTLARYLGLSLEQVNDIAHGKMGSLLEPVSYTHLTLPTNSLV